MRLQGSLEFLLILGAVSIICLGMIAVYANNIAVQKEAVGSLNLQDPPNAMQPEANATQYPQLRAYLPLNSTVGEPGSASIIAYGCSRGGINATLSSGSLLLSSNSIASGFSGVYIGSIDFVPESGGILQLRIAYEIHCEGAETNGSMDLETFAAQRQAQNGTGIGAYLYNRNESVSYGLSPPSGISTLNQWNHCTQLGFFGNPLDIQSQCGTANAWEYNVFSSGCYTGGGSQTATYCITPQQTGSNATGAASDNVSYSYSIQLQIAEGYGTLLANLSSTEADSPLTLDGREIGSARVVSVGSDSPYPSYELISGSGGYRLANSSSYAAYVQARNNLYGVLAYYNQSSVSGDVQSSINQAISAYTNSVSVLLNSETGFSSACAISPGRLSCPAEYPLVYTINATAGSPVTGNQVFYYDGSTINLRGA